jgi:hypothetical protein
MVKIGCAVGPNQKTKGSTLSFYHFPADSDHHDQYFRRNFTRCMCIIDYFEAFCERPSHLMAKAQTYKYHNTIKSFDSNYTTRSSLFISEEWGGRVSDKYLTENCGILNHLQPGICHSRFCGTVLYES